MTKFDEQPGIIQNQHGGQDLILPKEYTQRAKVGFAVALAKRGELAALTTIFLEHEFTPETVEYLIDCIVPRRRGRPSGSTVLMLYAARLEETKRVLRAQGHRRWGIHKKAMEILEADEPQCTGQTRGARYPIAAFKLSAAGSLRPPFEKAPP
jgi:hypothetical protein